MQDSNDRFKRFSIFYFHFILFMIFFLGSHFVFWLKGRISAGFCKYQGAQYKVEEAHLHYYCPIYMAC